MPLYVLTDPYTASASEIVAGALQDYGRATLVGETTFGKGLVQSIEPLSNGGALKATTAVYLTPKGRDINKKGIAPDVVAPDDPSTTTVDETVEAALKLIAGTSPVPSSSTTSTTSVVYRRSPLRPPDTSRRVRLPPPLLRPGPRRRGRCRARHRRHALPGPRGLLPRSAGAAAQAGDECEVVVGAAVYAATVLAAAPGGAGGVVTVQLGERLEGQAAGASYRFLVGLVQAMTRPSALDWSIEKSTEAGASLILLVQAAGSPPRSGKDSGGRLRRAGLG